MVLVTPLGAILLFLLITKRVYFVRYYPDSSLIRYMGRYDRTNSQSYQFDWGATEIIAKFKGTTIGVYLSDGGYGNFFNVFIDDSLHEVIELTTTELRSFTASSGTEHVIQLVKRTEGQTFGLVDFGGFEADELLSLPSPPASQQKMIFFGDSFTAGYGIEGPNRDCPFIGSEENSWKTYATLLAKEYNFEHHVIAVSGIGMVRNNGETGQSSTNPLPSYLNDICFSSWGNCGTINPTDFQPDFVSIFLGINDYAYAQGQYHPTPQNYGTGYQNFIDSLKSLWPGIQKLFLISYDDTATVWKPVVQQLATTNNAEYLDFYLLDIDTDLGCGWHPNVQGHLKFQATFSPVLSNYVDLVICSPACVNGDCIETPSVHCECYSGYSGDACDVPIQTPCDPPCSGHGTCQSSSCVCDEFWGGGTCSTRVCDPSCIYGSCSQDSTNLCECTTGWIGTACDQAICSDGCVNGNCIAPNACECDPGWSSSACDVPDCSTNGCVHGTCTQPDNCVCLPGWTANDCDTHTCSPSCENGGTCVGPNTCQCPAGFGGSTCSIVNCNCAHGTCGSGGPDDCSCDSGWSGTLCDSPACDPICANGGNCVAPNDCNCVVRGWTGSSCSIALCNPTCSSGVCTSPDVCTCSAGWTGNTCEFAECYGKREDDPEICMSHGICLGPNVCECDQGWNGLMCHHEVVDGAVCFGIPSNDIRVCSARGSCTDTDTCVCDSGFEGEMCEVEIFCHGLSLSDEICAGNGICIGTDTCNELGSCTVKDINRVLTLVIAVPVASVLALLCFAALVFLIILIIIKRKKVIEYVDVVRRTVRQSVQNFKMKKLREKLPPEEEFDDYERHPPRRNNQLLKKKSRNVRRNKPPLPKQNRSGRYGREKTNYNDDYEEHEYDNNYY